MGNLELVYPRSTRGTTDVRTSVGSNIYGATYYGLRGQALHNRTFAQAVDRASTSRARLRCRRCSYCPLVAHAIIMTAYVHKICYKSYRYEYGSREESIFSNCDFPLQIGSVQWQSRQNGSAQWKCAMKQLRPRYANLPRRDAYTCVIIDYI